MMEYLRSLKWIDYIFFCLIDPRRLVNLISRKEGSPALIGMIMIAAVSFVQIIAYAMLGNETGFFYIKITYGWIFSFLTLLLQVVILSALIDMISQLRSHNGQIKQVLSLVNISFFPVILLLPLVSIFVVTNFAPVFFYILFLLLLHIWQAVIIIQGISEIYQVGFGESVVIFILPFVFTGLVSFFAIILFFINFFGYLTNL
ncbi:MAG: YIP1 family protein [Spirochaetes bacterium]|nr:YIP1 family protein [Spirochaetota bacterium]